MTANAVTAPKDWAVETDDEGHGDYTLTWGVETTSALDGPDVALSASGLPIPGASLSALGGNPYAFFNRKGSAKLKKVDASRKYWDVTTVFTTRPVKRCPSDAFEDPLLEPHRVKGSFAQIMEELLKDVNGDLIQNTAEQRYTGALVQEPASRPVVELEMNVAWLDLTWLATYADSYNDATHWGMPARSIRCTTGPWERVTQGACSSFFFIVRFTFELKLPNWDIIVPNEGSRVRVAGTTPARYVQYKDEREENGITLLDANGYALAAGGTPIFNTFQRPKQEDFSAAGWPASLL